MKRKIRIVGGIAALVVILAIVIIFYIKKKSDESYYIYKYSASESVNYSNSCFSDGIMYARSLKDDSKNELAKLDLESGNVSKVVFEAPKDLIIYDEEGSSEEQSVKESFDSYMCVSDNGIFVLYHHIVIDRTDENQINVDTDYLLYEYDFDGKTVSRFDNIDIAAGVEVIGIYYSDNALYVTEAIDEKSINILVLSLNGQKICEHEDIDSMAQYYFVATRTMGVVYIDDGQIINVNQDEVKDLNIHSNHLITSENSEYEFLYESKNRLCGYAKDGIKKTLFRTEIKELYDFCLFYENSLYGLYWESEEQLYVNFLQFGKNRDKETLAEEREEIVLATVNACVPYSFISEFNSKNPDYKVVMKQFDTERDLLTYYGEGNKIDLFDLYSVDMDKLCSLGALVDLNEYLENDGSVSKTDFCDSFDALYEDNHLYYVSDGYRIETVVQNITDNVNWNFENMYNFAKQNRDDYSFDEMSSIVFSSLESKLYNKKSGEVFLSEKENMEILQQLECFNVEPVEEDSEALTGMLNGSGFLEAEIEMSDLVFVANYNSANTNANILSVSGYPTEQGGVSYVFPKNKIAMSSTCENKEAVWEFLRMFLSYEHALSDCYNDNAIPFRQDCLDDLNRVYTCKECYDDSVLGEIEPYEYNKAFFLYEIEPFYSTVGVDEVSALEKAIDAKEDMNIDYTVYSIFFEEMLGLKNGITIQNICSNIDKRINVYFSEIL